MQSILIIFSPSSALSVPHAQQHLVHPDDHDQLAQLRYYHLPPALHSGVTHDEDRDKKHQDGKMSEDLNAVLGLMGLARGLMAFSETFTVGSSSSPTPVQGRTHTITSSKKQTIIYNPPHTEIFILLIVRDPLWTEDQAKDVLQGAWERFTLNFGPDLWSTQASTTSAPAEEWWDRWLISCVKTTTPAEAETSTNVTSQQEAGEYGLKQWLSRTQKPCHVDVETRTGITEGQHFGGFAQGAVSIMKSLPTADAVKCDRVIFGSVSSVPSTYDNEDNDENRRKAIIYDTGTSFPPLTTLLLDMLLAHTPHQQRSTTPSASEGNAGDKGTMKRDRKRSPVKSEQEKEKEKGWSSLATLGLPRFGFGSATSGRGAGTGGRTGSSSSGTANNAGGSATGAGTVASWFGFGTDHSSSSSASTSLPNITKTPANQSAATRTEPKIVTDMNMESLNEALVTPVEAEFEGQPAADSHSDQTSRSSSALDSLDPLQWKVERIWLPSAADSGECAVSCSSSTSTGEAKSHGRMEEATLAYTFHGTSLVALVFVSEMSVEAIGRGLNRPETRTTNDNLDKETDIDSDTPKTKGFNQAVALLFYTMEQSNDEVTSLSSTQTKPSSSLRGHGATRAEDSRSSSHWLYTSRCEKGTLFKSSWKGEEIVFPSASTDAQQRVKTKNSQGRALATKGRRVVPLDQAGVVMRRSLMQIDYAEEMFARLTNDVWLIGKRQCPFRQNSLSNTDIAAKEEEAYLVLTAKETSIVDAECESWKAASRGHKAVVLVVNHVRHQQIDSIES
ncbi:hypothetical protein QFC21_000289 [Naganishia friedmannii]|uniref:Uncharacterized protein n=1 Tax=Naganishia friedmannii TaxID=89922 RepID=A0ACC2WC53_9TREE|nr:hypothetical protein QFC21_000289 [Naganishia friedmannii]